MGNNGTPSGPPRPGGFCHFSTLDTQLRAVLDPPTYELFCRKLTERELLRDPAFRWCPHCSFGFIFEGAQGPAQCPQCGRSCCPQCLQPGCPACGASFALARGGCLHFRCPRCQQEFCGGCARPFHPPGACGRGGCRLRPSLHCHHPRDCLFHLRDWDPPRLQRLLQENGVAFETEPPPGLEPAPGGGCPVPEQKEGPWGLRDEPCGRAAPPGHGGLCLTHYTEYLVRLANGRRLDPAPLYSGAELRAAAERHLERPPPPRGPGEEPGAYRERLLRCLMEEAPLDPPPAQP
ncbi:E3 ubiquitin-protein ligase RNF31 [Eudromia elegans]